MIANVSTLEEYELITVIYNGKNMQVRLCMPGDIARLIDAKHFVR